MGVMLTRRIQSPRFWLLIALAIAFIYYIAVIHVQHRPHIRTVRSSFDWGTAKLFYPPPIITPLPSGRNPQLRRIQHRFARQSKLRASHDASRSHAVKAAFQKCWTSYRKHAWMKDELQPLTSSGTDTFGGWAATIIDSLDTLWIMNLKSEFREAVEAVATLDWANTTAQEVNMFETTIRHLGGLLSAYDLSKQPVLLEKALELGDMLYAGFDTPNRMPPFWLNFEKARTGQLVAENHVPSTTPASLSMEFTRLSQLTGDPKYYDAIARVTELLSTNQNATKLPGMFPMFFEMQDLNVIADHSFSLGAMADSMYEYFPKMYALLGGQGAVYEKLYRGSMEAAKNHLLFRPMTPDNSDILFLGTVRVEEEIRLEPEIQHLTCFAGGMFALGGRLFDIPDHIDIGRRLTQGCVWAYKAFATGIMPEIAGLVPCETLKGCEWNNTRWKSAISNAETMAERLPQGFQNARDPRYILRPEAIESVFLLYRITGDDTLKDSAWEMFEAIQKATETSTGNAAIDDVTLSVPKQQNSMESFWLAETLKYFYLIFSPPDYISLDDFTFNTEAHPFRTSKLGLFSSLFRI